MPAVGGKDAAPGDEGYTWVCLGAGSSSLQVLRPRSNPAQTFPCFSIKSRCCRVPHGTSAPSPAQHGGETRGGAGAGRIEVLLSDTETFGGEGCTIPLFAPRSPRGVRLGLISRSAPPHAFGCTGVTSLRYADLFTLTLFPRGSGDLGEKSTQ